MSTQGQVPALVQQVGHIEAERGEAPHMPARQLSVDMDDGLVVDRPEIKQDTFAGLRHIVEVALHPYGPFIEEQLLILGVPVAWDTHGRRGVEVVFHQVGGPAGLDVGKISFRHGLHAVVVVAYLLRIYDIVPVSVERDTLPCIHILRCRRRCSMLER